MADGTGQAEAPQPPSARELRSLFAVFKGAKDRWKIDNATMKGYYLHSESGYLYIWNQPTGMLYEYLQSTGNIQAVWTSACPQLNAEIWTVLPLPPTDPASLQASYSNSDVLPNIDVYLMLTVAHEAGKQVPPDVIKEAVEEFCGRFQVDKAVKQRLRQLPPAGQGFVVQNFRGDASGAGDDNKALADYVAMVSKERPAPWGNSACTLRVEATGALIGRCCADLDALCRDDPPEKVAQAHCKIVCEEDRFFICDMETSQDGTVLDGFVVGPEWVGPLKTGSLLEIGPLRIKIQLSDMVKETPMDLSGQGAVAKAFAKRLSGGDDDGDDNDGNGNTWKRKVYQKTGEEPLTHKQRLEQQQRRADQYKDRAGERRKRHAPEAGSVAVDALINKFDHIVQAEKAAAEAEDARVDAPTQEDHREANMNVDGSFVGFGNMERAGIGFGNSAQAELIPNVLNPKNLSQQEASKLKTQMRFDRASGSGK